MVYVLVVNMMVNLDVARRTSFNDNRGSLPESLELTPKSCISLAVHAAATARILTAGAERIFFAHVHAKEGKSKEL